MFKFLIAIALAVTSAGCTLFKPGTPEGDLGLSIIRVAFRAACNEGIKNKPEIKPQLSAAIVALKATTEQNPDLVVVAETLSDVLKDPDVVGYITDATDLANQTIKVYGEDLEKDAVIAAIVGCEIAVAAH